MSKHTTEPTTVDQVLKATSGWRPITNNVDEQAEVFLEVRGDMTLVIVSASDENVLHLEPAAADALAAELQTFAAAARSIVIDRAVSA
jgi:hypothetical protein